jgi:predicted SAM-dependent methyltransferase
MSIFKSFKNFVRRIFIHPLGYDLVPLKAKSQSKPFVPVKRKATESLVALEDYIDLFGEKAVGERRFYNVGGGTDFNHPAWTVINHPSEHYGKDYMDLQWDLMSGKQMPIESGVASVIFSRYTLEHVTDEAVNFFLEDAYRVLAPGGYLRLIVPDIEIYYRAYLTRDAGFFYRSKQDNETFPNQKYLSNPNQASFEQQFLWNFASSASTLHPDPAAQPMSDQEVKEAFAAMGYQQALDFCVSKTSIDIQRRYPENHINWFDAAKLEAMIRKAGFRHVYRSGYGQSACAVLRDVRLLEARQPEVGLFFEATKSFS